VSPLSSTPSLSQDDTSSVSAAPLNVRNGNSHTPRPYDPIRKKLPSGGMYKSFTNALESPVPYGFHVAPPSVDRKTPSRLAAISVCFVASRGSTITRFTGTSGSPPSARLHVAPPSMLFAMRGKPAWGVTDVTYIVLLSAHVKLDVFKKFGTKETMLALDHVVPPFVVKVTLPPAAMTPICSKSTGLTPMP